MKTRILATMMLLLGVTVVRAQMPIYPNGDAKPLIQSALLQAEKTHKRVILDFGGNWCPDCRVLDIYFHQQPNVALLDANFVVVHVNVGQYDMDVAQRYGVPLKKGVPALVVLDSNGRTLLVQRDGEFESMGRMQSESVTKFLKKWKPAK
jgi:thioredoxin 1